LRIDYTGLPDHFDAYSPPDQEKILTRTHAIQGQGQP
jgi:hypothetical protein